MTQIKLTQENTTKLMKTVETFKEEKQQQQQNI